mmetsp:Transcript_103274/g.287447  ORF Transcript_103274/g.287447 Transcript_103274/m.287447 type:complete len:143 (-) Transcript_103274:308-736(-)
MSLLLFEAKLDIEDGNILRPSLFCFGAGLALLPNGAACNACGRGSFGESEIICTAELVSKVGSAECKDFISCRHGEHTEGSLVAQAIDAEDELVSPAIGVCVAKMFPKLPLPPQEPPMGSSKYSVAEETKRGRTCPALWGAS